MHAKWIAAAFVAVVTALALAAPALADTQELDVRAWQNQLGKAAEKWAAKIRNPTTRADKLGIKPGVTVRLVGEFDAGFVAETHAAVSAGPAAGRPSDTRSVLLSHHAYRRGLDVEGGGKERAGVVALRLCEQLGGRTFLYMISDDNFKIYNEPDKPDTWQRTLLMKFEVNG